MKESYKEELATHFGLDPYAGDGDIPGVASARGNAGQPLSSEITFLVCRRRPDERLRRGQTRFSVFNSTDGRDQI